uniref:Uncharacterized protein n=1 Tax=Balaenoptera musculus TaxID=9771 RepID=A0A8C0DXS4_BALMU
MGARLTRLHPLRQVPLSQLAYGPSTAPQVLYNPAQQILAYTGFCPVPPAVPTCSSYPLPLQVGRASAGRSGAHVPGSCHAGSAARVGHGGGGLGLKEKGAGGQWHPLPI